MANPYAGEVGLVLDGEAFSETVLQLIERFEAGAFSTRDVLALIVAGLRGGGWQGTASDLLRVEIEGGLMAATKAAARLLARAFAPPDA